MLLPNGAPTKFCNLVPKPRLKRKGTEISMSSSPDLGRPPGEELRRVTGQVGVSHYVQAALSILLAVCAAWLGYAGWHLYNLPNHGFDANDDSFGSGTIATFAYCEAMVFPGVSCFLFLFGGFSFLVGNRLIRRRSRRFCRVFAIFECFLGVAPVLAGFLTVLMGRLGVIDVGAAVVIVFMSFLSLPLTVITGVIGIYTLRMLSRQGASFV
jgi:hypothetical protein